MWSNPLLFWLRCKNWCFWRRCYSARKGNFFVFKKPGPLTHIPDCINSTDRLRVLKSVGILGCSVVEFVIVVISTALFAKMVCLTFTYAPCRTNLMSVNRESRSKKTAYGRQIFFFKRAVRTKDCNSDLAMVIFFITTTRELHCTNLSFVQIYPEAKFVWALRKFRALITSWELSTNMWSSRWWNCFEKQLQLNSCSSTP